MSMFVGGEVATRMVRNIAIGWVCMAATLYCSGREPAIGLRPMALQAAVELVTSGYSASHDINYIKLDSLAYLTLLEHKDSDPYIAKTYNYYMGEVDIKDNIAKCRGLKIIPHLQMVLSQPHPSCPWSSKRNRPKRQYYCYSDEDWPNVQARIADTILSIRLEDALGRNISCDNLKAYFLARYRK